MLKCMSIPLQVTNVSTLQPLFPENAGGQYFNNVSNKKSTYRCNHISAFFISDSGEARTLDKLIKSQLLYQLS